MDAVFVYEGNKRITSYPTPSTSQLEKLSRASFQLLKDISLTTSLSIYEDNGTYFVVACASKYVCMVILTARENLEPSKGLAKELAKIAIERHADISDIISEKIDYWLENREEGESAKIPIMECSVLNPKSASAFPEKEKQKERVRKSGWLIKRGYRYLKRWVPRWIDVDVNEMKLRYYKNDETDEVRGEVDLTDVIDVSPIPRQLFDRENCFQLKTSTELLCFLQAHDRVEQNEWIEYLKDLVENK